MTQKVVELPINKIVVEGRARKDLGDLDTLVDSIKAHGLMQPIVVQQMDSGNYRLVAGGRRLEACTRAGYGAIAATVYESLNSVERTAMELAENVVRKNMAWFEEVELKRRIDELQRARHGTKTGASTAEGWTAAKTAEMLGESEATTSRDLQIARFLGEIPELKKAKSKTEAYKMLRKVEERMLSQELLRRQDTGGYEAESAEEAEQAFDTSAPEPGEDKKESPTIITPERGPSIQDIEHAQWYSDKVLDILKGSYQVGDFFEEAQKRPDGMYTFAEVDPPYAIDLQAAKKHGIKQGSDDDYNEIKPDEYPEFLWHTFRQCYRLLADDGWMIVWFSNEWWHDTVLDLIRAAGFKCPGVAGVWYKIGRPGQALQPAYRLASQYEMFFYARKENATLNQRGTPNVFPCRGLSRQEMIHPTQRPVELMYDIIRTFRIGHLRVLVPFAGSGATLLAAWRSEGQYAAQRSIGFDKSEYYQSKFIEQVERIRQEAKNESNSSDTA